MYRWEIKFAFIHLPQSQNNYSEFMSIVLNPVYCMKGPLEGVNPSPSQLCVGVDSLIPRYPLSHDWCLVRTDPSPPLAVMVGLHVLSLEQKFFSTQNHC